MSAALIELLDLAVEDDVQDVLGIYQHLEILARVTDDQVGEQALADHPDLALEVQHRRARCRLPG